MTKKTWIYILIIILLSIPTFSLMLRYGIFSMQDFHYFRLVEFDKCIRNLQIPCRWASDSGAGFGEPLFNFYGQLPYVVGEIFHLISFSKIDSLKIVFSLSLVLSAISMFFLSKKIWNNNLSAVVSSIIYLYAPYRAVDVWVRGALPEAISFVFFPLIILEIENYLEKGNKKHLLVFSLLFSLMIINHNLSIILFAPFLIIWTLFRFSQIKKIRPFVKLIIALVLTVLISAFYILPVIFESKFIDINSTTLGVYDWRANFVTIYQLFISRFWGYGGSTWGPNDGLSLSLGQIQWIIPLVIFSFVILSAVEGSLKHNVAERLKGFLHFGRNDRLNFLVLLFIGLFALFLTHNKSTFIWNTLPFMKYIQFPWRFLGVAVFSLSVASGLLVKQFGKINLWVGILIILSTIAINFQFFRPDIWYNVNDKDLESGARWTEAMFSSIGDYWPNFGHEIPGSLAAGEFINYFPGWKVKKGNSYIDAVANKNGLILSKGAIFTNTPVRNVGNSVSIASFLIWIGFLIF